MVERIPNQHQILTSRYNGMLNPDRVGDLVKKQDEFQNNLDKTIDEQPAVRFNNKEQLEDIVNSLNDFLNPVRTSLKFELHEKLKEYYVTVVDDKTNEVVKEIPPKKMLDLYAAMAEMIGVIVDKKI